MPLGNIADIAQLLLQTGVAPDDYRDAAQPRHQLLQQFQAPSNRFGRGQTETRGIAARLRQRADDAQGNRIVDADQNDRNTHADAFGGKGGRRPPCDQDGDSGADQLLQDARQPLGTVIGPAVRIAMLLPSFQPSTASSSRNVSS